MSERTRKPTSPGELLHEEFLVPMGVTQKRLADHIGCDPKAIGLEGSPTKFVKIFTPPPREKGKMLKGDSREMAEELVELSKEKT